ncbi:MAG: rod shape-determining protein RodA, partial [Dokdonella sp.]
MRSLSLFAVALICATGLANAQDAAKPEVMTREHAPLDAKVFIVSPADGATLGQDVTVKFGVEGIALVPSTQVK